MPHATLPMFREWTDSLAAPLSLTDAGPGAFSVRPVIGDFDEDGAFDVAVDAPWRTASAARADSAFRAFRAGMDRCSAICFIALSNSLRMA